MLLDLDFVLSYHSREKVIVILNLLHFLSGLPFLRFHLRLN